MPITTFNPGNNSKVVIDGDRYEVQNGNKKWSIKSPDEHSLRFEVRPGDRWPSDPSSKERSEISGFELYDQNQIVTVSYDMKIRDGPRNNADWMALGQFHSDDPTSSPPVAVEMIGEHMAFNLRHSGKTFGKYLYKDPDPIERGESYSIKIEANFENNSGGFLKIWRDGDLLVNYKGPVGYGDDVYWKMGIYREQSNERYSVKYTDISVTTRPDNDAAGSSAKANAAKHATVEGTREDDTIAASSVGMTPTHGDDLIFGRGGDDTIHGRGGDDVIKSGKGRDWVSGGDGDDIFVFSRDFHNHPDEIRDFTPGNDTLELPGWIFRKLGDDGLTENEFHVGAAAQDLDDRLIYDPTTGDLFYDANGSAPGGVSRIARLDARLDLSVSDFLIS